GRLADIAVIRMAVDHHRMDRGSLLQEIEAALDTLVEYRMRAHLDRIENRASGRLWPCRSRHRCHRRALQERAPAAFLVAIHALYCMRFQDSPLGLVRSNNSRCYNKDADAQAFHFVGLPAGKPSL